jgi:hypothetical protein
MKREIEKVTRRVVQPARERWELGELVRAGGAEGCVVGRSVLEPAIYLVQFANAAAAQWFAHEEVASVA